MGSHVGIRKLLLATVAKTKDLLSALEPLPGCLDVEALRDEEIPSFDPTNYETPLGFEGYVSFQESIKNIIEREHMTLELLEKFQQLSLDTELKLKMNFFYDQIQRNLQILRDRLDLETMLSS
ncbi:MAG: hypothetical protein SNJ78_01645 [Spirochaetales bacterium]